MRANVKDEVGIAMYKRMLDGMTNKAIASELGVTETTVSVVRAEIRRSSLPCPPSRGGQPAAFPGGERAKAFLEVWIEREVQARLKKLGEAT